MLKYKRIKKNKGVGEDSEDDEEGQDTALVSYLKNFKGRCYKCGEFGHKKENFPKLRSKTNNDRSGRFNGTCFYCGKRGHRKSECREWKKKLEEMKSESTNIHHEKGISDVMLMGHEEKVPICKETLEYQDNKSEVEMKQNKVLFMNHTTNEAKINENIWIADSGASCHMTNSLEGMTDLKTDYYRIKIGNGNILMGIKKGTYERMVVSKDNKKTRIQLRNVRYVLEPPADSYIPDQPRFTG